MDKMVLLEWLARSEHSQYGECYGAALDWLVQHQLAQVHGPGEHQSGFIAHGTRQMYRAVSATAKGRACLALQLVVSVALNNANEGAWLCNDDDTVEARSLMDYDSDVEEHCARSGLGEARGGRVRACVEGSEGTELRWFSTSPAACGCATPSTAIAAAPACRAQRAAATAP